MTRACRNVMDFIRKHYDVPAKVGMRVKTEKGKGYIVGSAAGAHLRVRIDGEKKSRYFHPTYEIEYIEDVK